MDDDKSSKSWLRSAFNSVTKHIFSWHMLVMMAVMTLPMVGMAAASVGTSATLGDIGLATVDMTWNMVSAPFTHGGVIVDGVANAFNGNIAPDAYEWGGNRP